MPELPEVETVRRGLQKALKGADIRSVSLNRADLRTPFPPGFAKALTGRRIEDVSRRAKYLLFTLDSPDTLVAHLGMSGRFFVEGGKGKARTHDHVVFDLVDGRRVVFNDARRFGLMALAKRDALAKHKLFSGLGPEPLNKKFSVSYLESQLLRRKGPVKPALMDQALVVGVGNIYASEALFRAGIDPRKPAQKCAPKAKMLISAIQKVLEAAIESGGSSLRDFLHVGGEAGYFQHRFQVYGRDEKPCFVCGTSIRQIRQSGRSTYFCPNCQR